jgi:transposase
MSQQGMRAFSTEFRQAVVLRLEAGERIASVAEELKIRHKLLYKWRAAYRKLGAAGLNRKRGPKPGGACASPAAAPAPLTDLARAQARIAELEGAVGNERRSFQSVDAGRRQNGADGVVTLPCREHEGSSA